MNNSKWNDNRKSNAFKSTERIISFIKETNSRPVNTVFGRTKHEKSTKKRIQITDLKNVNGIEIPVIVIRTGVTLFLQTNK